MTYAGKYLVRTANVWWRCGQYFVISVDVCIWCMFVFMSVVVTVLGPVGTFVV